MAFRTFLGPILNGTVKNINPIVDTSATPSPTYLTLNAVQTSTYGGYRNTGASDAYQFISLPATTFTNIAAASFPYTFYPTYTVSGVAYPVVVPAGSYIDNINLDLTTAFTFSGSPTGFTIGLNLIGGVGSAYTTATAIATIGASAALTAFTSNTGRFVCGNSGSTISATNPLAYPTTSTILANTGVTDTLLQLVLTFNGGTTPAITAGALTLGIDYCMRSYDGTWYPQTPPGAPQTSFPQTY
jgi:hypothetical protein